MIDDSLVGRELDVTRLPIDRSKLAELGRALGDDDPVWHDAAAATAAGFEDVPVPPTVTVLVDHWRPDGALATAIALGMDLARVLHGEASWDYLAPVRLGDELTATTRVEDVKVREGKRGGTMTLVTVETAFANQRDELVVRRRDTLIERGA